MKRQRFLLAAAMLVSLLCGCSQPLPVNVTGVEVNPTSLSLVEGETSKIVATVRPADAENKGISWSSSSADIAFVDQSGTVTAIKEGFAIITATTSDGGFKTSCSVSVSAAFVHITSVSLNKSDISLYEGDSEMLVASFLPENSSNKNISWESDNAEIASVDQNGLVTAKAADSATITVTTEDGGKTATCNVTVTTKVIPVTDVSLDKTSLELTEGETESLAATVSPDNASDKSVTWSSNNDDVAIVDQEGKVTAVSSGMANITVTTTDGEKSASCVVLVCPKYVNVSDVSVSPESISLETGDSYSLTATVSPSNATDKSVTWSSNNTDVAIVNEDGIVSAQKTGSANITVTTKDGGKTAICVVTVIEKFINVTGVSVSPSSANLTVGENISLKATISPTDASNKNVSWSSSNSDVAYVDDYGTVTAVGEGHAAVTVTTDDGGKTASCAISVESIHVSSVSLSQSTLSLKEGESKVLTATVKPDNASNKKVSWTSSNNDIATVDKNGTVKAIKAGSATITAKTEDGGKTATCTVTVETIGVTGVSVSPTSVTITLGETKTLSATVSPDNASNKKVSWTSENSDIASVDNSGKITAKALGSTTITVTTEDGGKTAACSITVNPVHVSAVSLSSSTLVLEEGESSTLTATVTPNNATDKSITWDSANNLIATVDNGGKVTAVAAGTTTITVTSKDGNKTASCSVTVSEKVYHVESVSLNKNSLSITVGNSETLVATVNPSNATNQKVIWSSSKSSVASVDDKGNVTAVSVGTAIITVKTEDGNKTATCTVNVTPIAVTGVSLNQTSASLKVGESVTLTATVNPDNATDKTVTWSTTDETVASVSNGVVTAKKVGTATITAKAGEKTATCTITVVATPVTSVSLDKTSASLKAGESVTLTATVNPDNATNKSVSWSSDNTAIATVSDGVVTAVAPGSATITVTTADGGKTATCSIKVNPILVTEVTVSPTSLSLTEGDNQSLSATVTPDNATDKSLTWTSSNTSVATVDNSGKVTAVAAGSATITATSNDGNNKSGSCSVTVTAKTISVTGVSLDITSKTLDVGGQVTLTPTVAPANATNKNVSWSSSAPSVATVSDGVVTAVAPGSATITVTTTDGSKTATCSITVNPILVTEVTVSPTSLNMTEGDNQSLSATVTPDNATDKSLTWTSSNTSVATVDNSGKVTAVAAGSATITATSNDGSNKSGSCLVTVTAKTISVTGVSLDITSTTLYVGGQVTLTPTVAPSNATNKSVSWSSDNSSVASVTNGVVTAVAPGSATITVTTADGGKTATCSVVVHPKGAGGGTEGGGFD